MKFQKRENIPIKLEVEAFQWPAEHKDHPDWFRKVVRFGWAWFEAGKLFVHTEIGDLRVRDGVYLVRQWDCKIIPQSPAAFQAVYEKIDESI